MNWIDKHKLLLEECMLGNGNAVNYILRIGKVLRVWDNV